MLCYAAALTKRLRLGISVMLTALMDPIHLAKGLATLDLLSQGRLVAGAGLGSDTSFYSAFGISPASRVKRFEEGIRLIKKLWTEDKVSYSGRFWQMNDVSLAPKPLQVPHPPIWFGARAAPALQRAVRLGDGWMGAGASSTTAFVEQIKVIRQFMEEEGRDPATFPLSKRVFVAVDGDKKGASEKLRSWFGQHYGNPDMAREVSVYGGEEECVEGLAEVLSEGIDYLLLNPVYQEMEQVDRLARDVLPKVQS